MTSILNLVLQQAPPANDPYAMVRLFVPMIGFILIFWFLILRPQKKIADQHKTMVEALKRGDEVMTDGGIVGEVIHIKEDRITIKSGESKLIVMRGKIAKVLTPPATVTEA